MAKEPTELEKRLALRVISLEDQLEASRRELHYAQTLIRFVKAASGWPAMKEELFGPSVTNG